MSTKRWHLSTGQLSILLVVCLLLIDQLIKIWVKTHMHLGEYIEITPWCYIHFVENNGMAYGMAFLNKLVLSSLRIIAVGALSWYIWHLVHHQARKRYILLLSMVVAGAAGNIFDSLFYGLVFDASSVTHVSEWVPFGTGYAPCLMGKVVDMFYFPLFSLTWPEWMPLIGGSDYTFFSPIFNFADACISVAFVALLIFCRKELSGNVKQ